MSGTLWMERRGHGRPVVLLHGLADDHTLWRYVAGTLPGVVRYKDPQAPGWELRR